MTDSVMYLIYNAIATGALDKCLQEGINVWACMQKTTFSHDAILCRRQLIRAICLDLCAIYLEVISSDGRTRPCF